MENIEKIFVQPGFVHFSKESTLLYTVLGSGISFLMYDKIQKYGGMGYFIRPFRESNADNNTYFAYPAISILVDIMKKNGSQISNIEGAIFGGAENSSAINYSYQLGKNNIIAAIDIFEHKNIKIVKKDLGGDTGRKIVFHTESGDMFLTKEERIRDSDWYPIVSKK
ncbi:chemotaxis protein CheD [bacterium]|nr:chemotaxis protein CheD [bacterium]